MASSKRRKDQNVFGRVVGYLRKMKWLRLFFGKSVSTAQPSKIQDASPVAPDTDAQPLKIQDASPVAPDTDTTMVKLLTGVNSIVQFTKEYPVNNIRWTGIPIWPTIRFYLTIAVSLWANRKLKNGRFYMPIPSPMWVNQYIYENEASMIDDYVCDEPVDFIIFSANKSISWCEIDNKCYDRLIDPFVEKLKKFGTVKKFILVNSNGFLRNDFNIKPDFIMLSAQYTVNNSLNIENWDLFVSHAVKSFPTFKIAKKDLDFFMDMIFHLYSSYIKLLKKTKPKAVFFFPIDYNFPLILAAKSLGIPSVDIQHGNLIGYYLQYNQWSECNKDYKMIFPDVLLVWGQREKEYIERTMQHIKGVVGGYPWLDHPIFAQENNLSKLKNFCNKFDFLVGMSLSDHSTLPQIILDITQDPRASEKNIGFIFKRNPKRNNTVVPDGENLYAGAELTNIPFFSLAKLIDLHITEASTCFYEADYAGVQTFVVGKNWQLHFEELVNTGRITLIQTPDDFYEYFDQGVCKCFFPRLVENNNPEFDQFIRSLLVAPSEA